MSGPATPVGSEAPPTATRLALIGPFHPYRGGIAHFFNTLHRGLSHRGHAVLAVSFTRQYPQRLFPGTTQFEPEDAVDPIGAERILDSIGPVSWFRTAARVAAFEPDAVVFKYWMPFFAPAFGTIARRLRRRGITVIANIDNAVPHEPRPGDSRLSRYFLRACDAHIVMSDSVARDVDRIGATRPRVRVEHPTYDIFGDAVDRARARDRLGLDPSAPVIMFFGFVRRYKGLHLLLDAMPAITQALPNLTLLVSGEFYDDVEPYRARVRELGLERQVRMTGDYVPNEMVPVHFGAADVVVQPYLSATQSGVAQVAYHFDTPSIVTDVGGLSEVVPHERAGLVVPPSDPDALAGAVIRFFREGLRERLEAGTREEKARFGWDRIYEAIESFVP